MLIQLVKKVIFFIYSNNMYITIIPFFAVLVFYKIFKILNRRSGFGYSLFDDNFKKPQAFHEKSVPRLGGTLIFIAFIVPNIFLYEINILSLSFFLIFIIGILDDTKIFTNPKLKLPSLIFLLFIVSLNKEMEINYTDINYIDYLLNEYSYIKILFIVICLLTVVNGANFIDGFNGLLLLHSIIICIVLLLFLLLDKNIYNGQQIIHFLSVLIAVLILNFPNSKIFLGDSGSYIVGVIIAYFVISVHNIYSEISPFFWASLLFYLFFEVFFSFFRKIISKKNPLNPDRNHFHMLVYRMILKKINNKIISNYTTSILINSVFILLFLPAYFLKDSFLFSKIYFYFMILSYVFTYIILFKLSQKNK